MFNEKKNINNLSYFKDASKRSPEINFQANGDLRICGNSHIENPEVFYKEAIDWLTEFLGSNKEKINFSIQLNYVNSSSSKIILNMIVAAKESGSDLNVIWQYEEEDYDIIELGESLQTISGLTFEFLKLD